MNYLLDENPSVRKYLAIALKNYEEPAALKVLTRLLTDDHFNVRFTAFESLKTKGAKAKQYLFDLIDNSNKYPGYALDLARDILEERGDKNQ